MAAGAAHVMPALRRSRRPGCGVRFERLRMSATMTVNPTSTASRQWQFPLLLVSAVVFGAGLLRLIPKTQKPTFDDSVAEFRAMIDRGQLPAAHEQITQKLADTKL